LTPALRCTNRTVGKTHYDGGGSSGAQIAKGKIDCAPSFHDAILFQVSGFATDHDRER
jgi:hypothetical protein